MVEPAFAWGIHLDYFPNKLLQNGPCMPERSTPETSRPNARRPIAVQHRSRLHHLYYLLAAFDLVTVTLSLLLINQVAGSFEESVEVNELWAARLNDFAELSRLAAAVNAPGNDVFESRDPARESARLDEALVAFDRKIESLRSGFDDLPPEQSASLLPAVAEVNDAIGRMVAEARIIFEALAAQDILRAGEHMAAMDRQYSAVNLALAELTGRAQHIQERHLVYLAGRAAAVRRSEWLIAGLILLMIVGVTFYGQRLARQVREQAHITEELVEQRTRELEESHQRLRTAERLASIGTLAAGLGHDMNNVLFPVRCRLDVLDQADLPPDSQQELRSVRDSLDFLQQLSDGLRLLSADPESEAESVGVTDLGPWARQVEPLLRTALPKEVALSIEVPQALAPIAVAPHRLTQAIFNLVVNAGEAITGPGRVRLYAEEVQEPPSSIRVAVTDTGHGMSEEVRRQALDPFFTTKKRTLSTGLGLALVQGVAIAAGGSVEIESAPGRGTTVSVILPSVSAPQAGTPSAARSAGRAVVTLSDQRLGSFIEGVLASRGWEVEVMPPEAIAPPPDDALLWVIDAIGAKPQVAARFLDERSPRHIILACDEVEDEWDMPGVIPLRSQRGLAGILAAVEAAASAAQPPAREAATP